MDTSRGVYGQYLSYLGSFVALPRESNPPPRFWRDWAFFAFVVGAALIEGIVRDDVYWQPFTTVVTLLLALLILVRRSHAFLAGATTLIVINLAEVISLLVNDGQSLEYYSLAFVLVPMYCVFRWASGREGLWMLALMFGAWVVSFFSMNNSVGDIIGGGVVLLFAPLLGLEVRFYSRWREQQIEQARAGERELIARELHDTVAHHVSAIAIQAQAGLAVAKTSPDAAITALEVVEEQAARTLDEMRSMVGTLREGDPAELAPQAGVHDIARLDQTSNEGPQVQVELNGDLSDLRPSVDAALYRLAQESITNATRHANNATTVRVRIDGEDDCIQLTVIDDGDRVSSLDGHSGYGLLGMAERAKLLGGSLSAGPGPRRGWMVSATLPRAAVSA
ncbi:MAG: sensor histidine kinase [Acidimicrobiia bacterium]|nr:sensor histidine kinase [Acidimicrobiia bacterium]